MVQSILYIDDDPQDHVIMRLIVSRIGRGSSRLTSTTTLEDGLKELKACRYSLIVLDNRLDQQSDVLEALESLRDHIADAVVLIVSDYVEEIDPRTVPDFVSRVAPKERLPQLLEKLLSDDAWRSPAKVMHSAR